MPIIKIRVPHKKKLINVTLLSMLLFKHSIICITLILWGCSISCQEVGLVEILRAQNGLHKNNIDLSSIRFDSIKDSANPRQPYYVYKDKNHNISKLQLSNQHAYFTYWTNHSAKTATYITRGKTFINYFNEEGIQIKKEEYTDQSHIIFTFNYDTIFKTYLNPSKQVYLQSAQVNNHTVWTKSTPLNFEISLSNFGGAPFQLISSNNHSFTNLVGVDSLKLTVKTKKIDYNENVTWTLIQRDTVLQLDFITSITQNAQGDTTQIAKAQKKITTNGLIGATWIEKIYYPNHPILYKREVWIKQGVEQTKMYYNKKGDAIAKTYFHTNKPPKIRLKKRVICGTPNQVTEELIPGYLKVYDYYNTQNKTIDSVFLKHKKFSYYSYFYSFPAQTNGFYYKSGKVSLPSEPHDLLITEKGEISVAELRQAFLFYLWNKRIKHYPFPTHHVLVHTRNKGWNISYHHPSKKASQFEKAFNQFIQPYGKIKVVTARARQLLLIQGGQKQVATYPITELWWEMQW